MLEALGLPMTSETSSLKLRSNVAIFIKTVGYLDGSTTSVKIGNGRDQNSSIRLN